MAMKFTYHQDPSHGWVEVSVKALKELGADLSKISAYSYCRPMTTETLVYLEEDGDVMVLINALKERDIEFEFESVHTNHDCFCRSLPLRFPEWLATRSVLTY